MPNGRRETVRPASIGASFVEVSKKWRKPSKSIDDYRICNSDEDVEQFNAWMQKFKPGYCAEVSEDPEFRRYHGAKGYVLACSCLEFTFRSL